MGEIHINVWRENLEEGVEVTFEQRGICAANGKPRYELAIRTKSGGVISFWTCDPNEILTLFAQVASAVSKALLENSCANP